jgi:hypothetical protein
MVFLVGLNISAEELSWSFWRATEASSTIVGCLVLVFLLTFLVIFSTVQSYSPSFLLNFTL